MTRGTYAACAARLAGLAAAVELRHAELGERYHGNEPNAPCRDCRADTLSLEPGVGTEFYIVDSRVWADAGMEPSGGCLCIGCLERRLGRRLLPGDFTDAPINALEPEGHLRFKAWAYRTRRLTERLTGQLALWEDDA